MRQEKKAGSGTKRALLTSVLAIVLCLVMLVGSTFAWFTDTASTGVNKIVSGKLDVGLQYWGDGENGEKTWLNAEDSKKLFDENALWEPGYTQIIYLKVKNNGNLALNYAMQITPVHETVGVNVNGDEFKLSDYIQFGWAELTAAEDGTFTPFADRTDARDAVGESVHLGEALHRQAELPLAAEAEELVALVAWMPEEVGNVANYRDVAPSIELTLKVLATQATVESDSFGNTYDAAAATEEGLDSKPEYNYSYTEEEGVTLITDENGKVVKAIVSGVNGKVPDGLFSNLKQSVDEEGNPKFDNNHSPVMEPDEKWAALTEVVIEDGVTEIGKDVFQGCVGLTNVTIPDSVQKIGALAFYLCEGLKNVDIPANTEIGNSSFRQSGLEQVTVSGGSVGQYAFHRNVNLKEIDINCETIGDEAFSGCNSLTDITLGSSVKTLGRAVFYTCQGLKSVEIPSTVTDIGEKTFLSCFNLENAVIKGGTVKSGTFNNCGALKTLIISDNGKMDSTFKGSFVRGLETLEVYGGEIGASAFVNHQALVTVTVGEEVTSVGNRAFASCAKLKEATINTEAMNGYIFYNSGVLNKVTFGDTVKTIPATLFHSCNAMKAGGAIYVKPGTWNIGNKSSIMVGDDGLIPVENVKTITAGNGMQLTYVTTP